MSRADDVPEPLLAGKATEFERRLLEEAMRKGPPPGSAARMARALGVGLTAPGTLPSAPASAATKLAADSAAAPASAAATPWIAVAVVGLVVGGALLGVASWRGRSAEKTPSLLPAQPAAASPESPLPPPAEVAGVNPGVSTRRARSSPGGGSLREQIAYVDSARTAVAQGAARRALDILRHYDEKYPFGSFSPEANAIRVEALLKLGRRSEARAIAAQLVAEHEGSLLAKKVADLVGLNSSTPAP